MNEKRIKYLENLLPEGAELKHFKRFSKESQSMGNGVYRWGELYSTDTRELFLMGVLTNENIKFKNT